MKKVMIIGWSSGIWEQLSIDMYNKGYKVAVTWRRKKLLQRLRKQHNNQIEIQDFDISDTKITIQNMENLAGSIWWLDIFVLSAWIGKDNINLDFDIENQTIQTNVVGRTNCIDRATNYFIQQWSWYIVVITSIAALRGAWWCPSYNATKAYQSNYIESLRLTIEKRGAPIKILEVQPWFIDTRMAQWKVFWVCSVQKASKQILQAIRRWKTHIYISKRWRLIAWLMKIIPYKIYKEIIND